MGEGLRGVLFNWVYVPPMQCVVPTRMPLDWMPTTWTRVRVVYRND